MSCYRDKLDLIRRYVIVLDNATGEFLKNSTKQ